MLRNVPGGQPVGEFVPSKQYCPVGHGPFLGYSGMTYGVAFVAFPSQNHPAAHAPVGTV